MWSNGLIVAYLHVSIGKLVSRPAKLNGGILPRLRPNKISFSGSFIGEADVESIRYVLLPAMMSETSKSRLATLYFVGRVLSMTPSDYTLNFLIE